MTFRETLARYGKCAHECSIFHFRSVLKTNVVHRAVCADNDVTADITVHQTRPRSYRRRYSDATRHDDGVGGLMKIVCDVRRHVNRYPWRWKRLQALYVFCRVIQKLWNSAKVNESTRKQRNDDERTASQSVCNGAARIAQSRLAFRVCRRSHAREMIDAVQV